MISKSIFKEYFFFFYFSLIGWEFFNYQEFSLHLVPFKYFAVIAQGEQ